MGGRGQGAGYFVVGAGLALPAKTGAASSAPTPEKKTLGALSPQAARRGGNPSSNDRGLTLVELSVVMVIMGILLVALGFSFVGWRDRYRAEGDIRKLHMDMMAARAKALQTKTAYFINMPTTVWYQIYEDRDDDGAWDATDRLITNTTMTYDVTAASTRHFTFSRKGMVDPTGSIALDNSVFEAGSDRPDYDCIAVGTTRINSGLWNFTTSECDEK